MKIFLVDDHPLFLEGLKNLLIAQDIEVVGTATGVSECLWKTEILQPDLILMDVQMPEGGGIEATRQLKAKYPLIKIIMLTVSQDDNHLFEAIKAGASGYLFKGLSKEKFLELLQGINDGEAALSPGMAGKLMAEFARRENEREAREQANQKMAAILSSRQIEILQHVAEGMTYKEVGDTLVLTEAAIKYHMGEIMNRLHLENRSQAVAYATEAGMIYKKNNR